MLRFTPIQDAGAAGSYYGKTDGGYYLDSPELHREVGGKGAERLGLAGRPDEKQFQRLLQGLHPVTGERLTARLVEDRVAGWDMTASIPKGVTEAIEGGDERVQAALWQAVRESAADVEAAIVTRVCKGGKQEDRLTGNLIWYAFEHPETRPTKQDGMPRPDRHIHVVMPSVTFDDAEQQWKAIKWRPVVELRKYWSHRFDLRLSTKLADLGYQIETKHQSDGKGGKRYYSWDIAGMPATLIARDSQRHREIEQLAEELGATSALEMGKMGATSRKVKRQDLTLEDCRAFWESCRTPEETRARDQCIRRAMRGLNPKPAPATAEAVRFAIEHEFYRQPVVDSTDLEITAMERMMGRGRPEDLAAEFQKQGALRIGDQATTEEIRQQEAFLIRFARNGRGKKRPVMLEPGDLEQLLVAQETAGEIRLTGEQSACIRSLVGSRDAVNIVDAGQGTGKTTMLEQFGAILDRHDVRTTWLGTTHTAVGELKARGLPAMTLAHFLASQEEQRKAAGTRIIVDEASMLAHGDAYRLCQFAQAHGCRLNLVGDSRQYKSPVGGHTLRLLTRFAGVAPITMTRTMRQQGRLKEAMEAIRDGDVLKGHDTLSQLGFVHELPQDQLAAKAAERYLAWSAKGEPVPVISPTWAQAEAIAVVIRQGLRARDELTGEDQVVRRLVNLNWTPAQLKEARQHGAEEGVTLLRYGAYREDSLALAVGDQVKTTMGGTTKDGQHRLRAGQHYRIAGFTAGGDLLLNSGWVVDQHWGGLMQGYVSTGQGAQGLTADRAIVVYGTPSLVATRQEGFYVPVSRVRKEVAVLTDSNPALREAIQRQDTRLSATDLFAGRERQKRTLWQRLRQHLTWMRRLAFAQEHERRPTTPAWTRPGHLEIDYGR
jgi:conjugative relaxase-like TrwC/TraI family protein